MPDQTPSPSAGVTTPVAEATATALLVTALFVQHVIGGFYLGLQRELPDGFPLLSSVFLCLAVVTWFSLYSRKHHIPWVLDMGWFLFAAWVIVIPYYVLKREGRAGLPRI